MIQAERKRQQREERWTAAHDTGHDEDEMAIAAACYALPQRLREQLVWKMPLLRLLWPWEQRWWKPVRENRIRELVKAGALIAAEIDRLRRLERAAS